MNESLANSNAEEKSKKGNTIFKNPGIIGKTSMVVNGTSDAFSRKEEDSTTNGNKYDVESELSRKPYYNFNAFPIQNRKVIDKVAFDINDSEDLVEEKLSKSASIKEHFKFSTYLRSSRQGKMFGNFALDQGAFLGLEYTEVNLDNNQSAVTVERKELRVKLGRNGIFSTLEDASNDKATSGTVSEIGEQDVPELLDNIKNYTSNNKIYFRWFNNSNTFVRKMAESISLTRVAELHSPFTAGSAANKVHNYLSTVSRDYSEVGLQQYPGQNQFRIFDNSYPGHILKNPINQQTRRGEAERFNVPSVSTPKFWDEMSEVSEEELASRSSKPGRKTMGFAENVADLETKQETPLSTYNRGDEDEKQREKKKEFYERMKRIWHIDNEKESMEIFNSVVPTIALQERTRENYKEYKKNFDKNFSMNELIKTLNSQIFNYNRLIEIKRQLNRDYSPKLEATKYNIIDEFIDEIGTFLEASADAIVKYGEVLTDKEKEGWRAAFDKMVEEIKRKGMNPNVMEIKTDFEKYIQKGKEIESMRSKKYRKWSNYEECKKDFFEENGNFSISRLEKEFGYQKKIYKDLFKNNEEFKNLNDTDEKKEKLKCFIITDKNEILNAIEGLVMAIPCIVENYKEEINDEEKALWKDAFNERINLIQNQGWDLELLGISDDFNTYLEDSRRAKR